MITGSPRRGRAYSQLLSDHAPIPLVATDDRWRILACNPAVTAVTGHQHVDVIGRSLGDLMTRASGLLLQARYAGELLVTGVVEEVALDLLHRDGDRIPVLLTGRTATDPALPDLACVTAITPVGERRSYERDLMAARRRAEASERRLARLTRVTRRLAAARSHEAVDDALATYRREMASDGDAQSTEDDAAQLAAEQSRGRIALLARLEGEARTDPLTGLANRRALEEVLQRMQTGRAQGPLTVLFIDLDDFKGVNDRHGHLVGDRVLVAVARTLEAAVPRADVVARIGGDEFVVLTSRPGSRGEAEELRAAVAATIARDAAPDSAGVSIGLVHAAADDGLGPVHDLLARADAAMYAHKRGRRHDDVPRRG